MFKHSYRELHQLILQCADLVVFVKPFASSDHKRSSMDFLADQLRAAGFGPTVAVKVRRRADSANLAKVPRKPQKSRLRQMPPKRRNELERANSTERARSGKLRKIITRLVQDLNA